MPVFTHSAAVVVAAFAVQASIASGTPTDCELTGSSCSAIQDSASLFQHKTTIKGPLPDLFGETAPKFADEVILAKDSIFAGNSTAFWLTAALDLVVCGLIARAWCGCCRSQAADEFDGPTKAKKEGVSICKTSTLAQAPAEVAAPAPPKVVLGSISEVLDLANAVRAGDAAQCAQLLERDNSLAKTEDHWGCSALHVASDCGSASLTKMMLEFGASVNAQDSWEETPLHFAARAGSADTCEILIARRAEIDSRNSDEATPLLLAAQKGNEDVCELLLTRGAGVAGLSDEELPPMLSSLLVRRIFAGAETN